MPKRYLFHRERNRSNPVLIFTLSFLVIGVLLINQAMQRKEIKPLFLATPTATRMANSYILEARTHFDAGNLDQAIASFKDAITIEPNNGSLYAERARVLTYSSQMVTTDAARESRLKLALDDARKGVQLAPNDSTCNAILAFVLDWYATYVRDTLLDEEQGKNLLLEADRTVSKATFLDQNNIDAQIYYAEIMIDFQRFNQARDAITYLLKRAPDSWEAHRVNGLYLENQGEYEASIQEYEKASELAPNMTFLVIKLGQSSRQFGMTLKPGAKQDEYFDMALKYFDKAAGLNDQLGIKDPYPYLGIGYTYGQMGEFFAASRNMRKALSFDPTNPKVYGDLGMVSRQGKNYDLAKDALQCAVQGCDADTSCRVRQCDPETEAPIVIKGLPLNPNTVSYYFTYAAILSGLYVDNDPKRANYCTDALKVIAQVRAVPRFNNEPIYDSIMKDSEAICAFYGFSHAAH